MKTKESKNVIDKIRFDGKTRHEALCELYNTLSNEDFMHLINMAQSRLFIWNPHDKTCYDLDIEVPCCPNGAQIQINIQEDGFKFKPMVSKEK